MTIFFPKTFFLSDLRECIKLVVVLVSKTWQLSSVSPQALYLGIKTQPEYGSVAIQQRNDDEIFDCMVSHMWTIVRKIPNYFRMRPESLRQTRTSRFFNLPSCRIKMIKITVCTNSSGKPVRIWELNDIGLSKMKSFEWQSSEKEFQL